MSPGIHHTLVLDERPYGPDSTGDERAAIANRVSVIAERVLLVHEMTHQTPFSVDVMFDRIEALSQDWSRFCSVVDLSAAKRPDAATRAVLKGRMQRIIPRLAHMSVVVGQNPIMRAMARLVAHFMGLASVSTHATRAEAIEEAGRALAR